MSMIYRLTIPNWHRFNPRGDVKAPSWFRLDMRFADDPQFVGDPELRLTWIALMCERTKAGNASEEFEVRPDVTAGQFGIGVQACEDCIKYLINSGNIVLVRVYATRTSRARNADGTSAAGCVSPRDGTGRDGTERERPESGPRADRSPPLGDERPADHIDEGPAPDPEGLDDDATADLASVAAETAIPDPALVEDRAIAEDWARYATDVSSTVRPRMETWADTVRLMRTRDKLSHAAIREILAFVRDDHSFWRDVATSLPGMRERSKNGRLKHENAAAAMRRAKVAAPPPARTTPKLELITAEELEAMA